MLHYHYFLCVSHWLSESSPAVSSSAPQRTSSSRLSFFCSCPSYEHALRCMTDLIALQERYLYLMPRSLFLLLLRHLAVSTSLPCCVVVLLPCCHSDFVSFPIPYHQVEPSLPSSILNICQSSSDEREEAIFLFFLSYQCSVIVLAAKKERYQELAK